MILRDVKVGMKTRRQTVRMDFDQHMGELYPFSLREKLKVITEPSRLYEPEHAAENKWGRPIIPFEMLSVLFQYRSKDDGFPTKGPAVGLFADQEIRLLDGPLFVGESYEVEREVVALSGSRRTESLWARTSVFRAANEPSDSDDAAQSGEHEGIACRLCERVRALIRVMSRLRPRVSMTETYQTIRLERSGAVALLTLARPERLNAIDKRMLGELQHALDAVERDDEVRALVVKGAGGNFSSGFDLKEQMEVRPTGFDAWREILDRDFSAVTRFWHLNKPTIAAVQGYCLAGGCELALCCDITIAAEDAIFGEPELKFGAGIVVMILPWLVGPKRAKEIILGGADRITAAEALRIGLVNRVVRSEEVESAAIALARHIAVIDPDLVRQTKRAINQSFEIMGLVDALNTALDIDLAIEGKGSDDKRKFMEIARKDGLRKAIAWRDARFGGSQDG